MIEPPLHFAVIGSPVAHSRSPAMHMAAFASLGLPHLYTKIETTEDELASRVEALRTGTFAGLNVTVPHKTNVLAFVDEIDPSAQATGAANTLVRDTAGRVRAHNTDAPALADELLGLQRSRSSTNGFAGKTAIVLGTGGAARAALYALGTLGFARVIVRGRREKPELASVLKAASPDATLIFERLEAPANEPSDLAAIVQATTAGMDGASTPGDVVADAIAWSSVQSACVVLDVVYAPAQTPLLHRAAAQHLANTGGLGMLVRQGALAFELWLGVAPPLDVMRAAI